MAAVTTTTTVDGIAHQIRPQSIIFCAIPDKAERLVGAENGEMDGIGFIAMFPRIEMMERLCSVHSNGNNNNQRSSD